MTLLTQKQHLSVVADAPDLRDRFYEPSLTPLRTTLHPPGNLYIQNQKDEGACTGFGLAATINLLFRQRDSEDRVSPRMLYEMAKRYDKWVGEDYEGSSCRGAIKGWINSGVCEESLAPYQAGDKSFYVTPAISKDAKSRTVGAYYRLRPVVSDFHAALNEAGVVFCSAIVHKGWYKPKDRGGEATITPDKRTEGGHAFAIVGYNSKGFWVQNSWGEAWGDRGLALWLYEDWAESLMDAWVVQLALPTPQIFDSSLNTGTEPSANQKSNFGATPRLSIEDHFVHLDDGRYHDNGRYWSNKSHIDVVQSAIRDRKLPHLLLYAHGGLNSIKASATRIAALKQVFLDNGIYPFHFMYDTGLLEELKDVILNKDQDVNEISGGFRDWLDRRIENLTKKPGRALWREMKRGAESPFRNMTSDGTDVLKKLVSVANDEGIQVHLAGHSTGAILHAFVIERLMKLEEFNVVETCSLLAPAATNQLFEDIFLPALDSGAIQDMAIYNLTDSLEKDDSVAGIYGKSLLYLVSRAFEESSKAPILGMQKHNSELHDSVDKSTFVYSNGKSSGRSKSSTHGGFDNDPATMNDLLARILKKAPIRKFEGSDLDY